MSASLRVKAPMRRFSSTVRGAKTRRPSGTRASPPCTAFQVRVERGQPSSRMVPPASFTRPISAFIKVDLPAPLAPMTETISPSMSERENPESAAIAP